MTVMNYNQKTNKVRTRLESIFISKAIIKVFDFHHITITDRERKNLIDQWFRTILRHDPACKTLFEITKTNLIPRPYAYKTITQYENCKKPNKIFRGSFAPTINQFLKTKQGIVILEIAPVDPPHLHQFLIPEPIRYTSTLYRGGVVSINHQLDSVYQYKKNSHLVTSSGKLLWLGDRTKTTLLEMGLRQNYETYRELSYSNIKDQIALAHQTTNNRETIRRNNILEIILPDVPDLYANNSTSRFQPKQLCKNFIDPVRDVSTY